MVERARARGRKDRAPHDPFGLVATDMITCPKCGQTQLVSHSEIDTALKREVIEFPCIVCKLEWRITLRARQVGTEHMTARRFLSQKLRMVKGKRVAPNWETARYKDHA